VVISNLFASSEWMLSAIIPASKNTQR